MSEHYWWFTINKHLPLHLKGDNRVTILRHTERGGYMSKDLFVSDVFVRAILTNDSAVLKTLPYKVETSKYYSQIACYVVNDLLYWVRPDTSMNYIEFVEVHGDIRGLDIDLFMLHSHEYAEQVEASGIECTVYRHMYTGDYPHGSLPIKKKFSVEILTEIKGLVGMDPPSDYAESREFKRRMDFLYKLIDGDEIVIEDKIYSIHSTGIQVDNTPLFEVMEGEQLEEFRKRDAENI